MEQSILDGDAKRSIENNIALQLIPNIDMGCDDSDEYKPVWPNGLWATSTKTA